jgi:hypothetical protein
MRAWRKGVVLAAVLLLLGLAAAIVWAGWLVGPALAIVAALMPAEVAPRTADAADAPSGSTPA